MILPIYGYGQAVLKRKANSILEEEEGVAELIENMFETMYHASGVGLAAPQIGLSKRLFIVDTQQVREEDEEESGIKQAFLNATIIREEGEEWVYEEGCLSIPKVRGDVERKPEILIRYQDPSFEWHEEKYTGIEARVIQHEYDHIEGILFTEWLKPLRKRRIKRKLDKIRKGQMQVDYPMKFAMH